LARIGLPNADDLGDQDIPDLIAELAELNEKGILSYQEFHVKKQELLDRL
jgi:hypothetical protein